MPRRNPQLRQNRKSDGIAEWQFEQVIVGPGDSGISGFCDMTNQRLKAYGRIYDDFLYAK
ncbi:MAG TPA: hypothetical protein VFO72_08875 [Pyrinomonadaceae bacterium]|nr:hypothetical protein [Pyrinomonadaceae bacterium]